MSCRSAVAGLVALVAVCAASKGAEAAPPHVRGALPLAFRARPSADGTARVLPGASVAPVTIRFSSDATKADVAAVEALGAVVERRRDGSPRGRGPIVAADVPASAVPKIAALDRVVHVALDGAPVAAPPPLDLTTALISAPDVWKGATTQGATLTGEGMTICDIDSGIDVFHPLFFRADGGYFRWIDVDHDGAFSPGVDGVDLKGDGAPVVLRVLDSVLRDRTGAVMYDSDDPRLSVGWDWLYADLDGSGARESGPAAGFTEADPAYGEPLFVVDDVNRNGRLDVGEKLVALKTSKIRTVKSGAKIYRRGDNLIDLPIDPKLALHGTGAMSILVAGNRGLNRLVGVAPDADLVTVLQDQSQKYVANADFCIEEGARVVLHEYAPWVGFHLDGSSDLEAFIDKTVDEGVTHINPVGNLSTADKMCKRPITAGGETIIPIEAPPDSKYAPFHLLGASILWRDVTRAFSMTLEDPTGFSMPLALDAGGVYKTWQPGVWIWAAREDSPRKTARVDIYVYGVDAKNPAAIPAGTWKLHVVDAAPAGSGDVTILGGVMDDTSRWAKGIYFSEFPNEDHLIGFPATADHAIGVAAYTAHDFYGGTPGQRAFYSGRGHRFDGSPAISISAPDNPITGGPPVDRPATYMLFGGTSGASPHVAGAALLLLEAHPEWSGDDVRTAIRKGAEADAFVGTTPNEDYGYGKLDVYRSLYGKDPKKDQAPRLVITPRVLDPGEHATIGLAASDAEGDAAALVYDVDYDYDGVYDERLAHPWFDVRFDAEGTYVSKVRVTDSDGNQASALSVVRVARVAANAAVAPGSPEDDGCSMHRGGTDGETDSAWTAVALGLFGLRASRLRRRPGRRRATLGR